MSQLFPISGYAQSGRGENILMHHFFLDNFLEIDICILPLGKTEAKRPDWRVVFDHTVTTIDQRMSETWEKNRSVDHLPSTYDGRVAAIWHYVLHAVVAVKRGHCWQALSDIEDIRDQAIELHGLQFGLTTKRNKEVHKMGQPFLRRLETTLVDSLTPGAVKLAIREAVAVFFEQARAVEAKLGLPESSQLERQMTRLLDEL